MWQALHRALSEALQTAFAPSEDASWHASRAILSCSGAHADDDDYDCSPESWEDDGSNNEAMLWIALAVGCVAFLCVIVLLSVVYGIAGLQIACSPLYPSSVQCLCWTPNGRDACCSIPISNLVLAVVQAMCTAILGIAGPWWPQLPTALCCLLNISALVLLVHARRRRSTDARQQSYEEGNAHASVAELTVVETQSKSSENADLEAAQPGFEVNPLYKEHPEEA